MQTSLVDHNSISYTLGSAASEEHSKVASSRKTSNGAIVRALQKTDQELLKSAQTLHLLSSSAISKDAEMVRRALRDRGLVPAETALSLPREEKLALLEHLYSLEMSIMGMSLEENSLRETPKRRAKKILNDECWGMDWKNFPSITTFENSCNYKNEAITISGIQVNSLCEHHFSPVTGTATVAYIPTERYPGLSKPSRLVAFFASRPQVQERLTLQVQVAMQTLLKTDDVAVIIEAGHSCMTCRGIKDRAASTTTQAMGGVFEAGHSGIRRQEVIQVHQRSRGIRGD